MADKRMLTKKITDADEFISMPSSAQALYLHLNQGADDDGFNNQVQMSMFKAHASVDDLKVLLAKRYIIQFESGVIVIKHWRMSNALRKDRYTPTAFQEELKMLKIKDNGAYSIDEDVWLPNGCQMVATGKDSIGKDSIGKDSIGYNYCSELETNSEPIQVETPILQLPLNDNSMFDITETIVKEYQELYPAVDVLQEFRNMKGWCMSNPRNRKTKSGIRRFINSWLAKEQNKGGNRQSSNNAYMDSIKNRVNVVDSWV